MRVRNVRVSLPVLAGLFLICAGIAPEAQGLEINAGGSDSLVDPSDGSSDRWRFSLALGALAVPDYEGSDDYEAAPLPIARVQKGDLYAQVFGLKFTSNVVPHPNFRLGPVVNYRRERDDVDNGAVDALSDVDAALELGLQAGYDYPLGGGVIGAELEWVIDVADGHEGWLLTPQVHYRRPIGDRWRFNLAVSTTYASDNYMDSYFGISAADSAASGLPVFTASDGLRDVSVNLGIVYGLSEQWDLGLIGTWKRLLEDAEDSPVTEEGDENQFIAGLYVSYSWMSPEPYPKVGRTVTE